MATLSFGVGRADEPARLMGITHLVEHLVMHALGDVDLDMNGTTEAYRTAFTARGTPDQIRWFIRGVCSTLAALPMDRLSDEATVLRNEWATRGGGRGVVEALAWLRCGYAGLGLGAEPEFFLTAPDRDEVRAWVDDHYVSENAVLWVCGDLPADLEVVLPHGSPRAPVAITPIDGLRTPTAHRVPDGGIAASFIAPRSDAAWLGFEIVERRLKRRVRHDRGLGYVVARHALRLTDTIHVSIWVSCGPETTTEAASALVSTLDEVATEGPTPDELARAVDTWRRRTADQAMHPGRLDAAAMDALLGRPWQSLAEQEHDACATRSEDVAAVMRSILGTTLLTIPARVPVPDGFWAYPGPKSPPGGDGRVFDAAQPGRRRPWDKRADGPRLSVRADGVAVMARGGGTIASIPWDDCVLVVREARRQRRLYGRDGYGFVLQPADWRDGDEAVDLVDQYAPSDRTVFWVP